MFTLARNADNDIFATANGLAIASDGACRCIVADSIILTQKGELQFDESRGIDYFGTVFQNPKYLVVWAGQVRKAITKLDWVKDIKDFTYSFDRAAGAVTWTMTIETEYGETVTVGSNGRSFTSEKGDGRMGIRWSDIIDKPTGIETVAPRVDEMKQKVAELADLLPKDTLKSTKDKINQIRQILASM